MANCKVEPTILWIFFCALIQNTSYGMIAPFLPICLNDLGVTPLSQGFIFAIYAVAVILFSPVVSKLLLSLNGKTLIYTGMFLMGMVFALFGLLNDKVMVNTTIIVIYSIFLRILQGIASATIQTTCYAIGTNEYPD